SWHHYTFVFEKVTNTSTNVSVYLDGGRVASQVIPMGVDAFANAEPLTLGFNTQVTNLGYTHMDLADFRVWNRALTDTEARNIPCMRNIDPSNPLYSSLIAHYRDMNSTTWFNPLDNGTPDLTFSNTPLLNVSANYPACERPSGEVLGQYLAVVPPIFYW